MRQLIIIKAPDSSDADESLIYLGHALLAYNRIISPPSSTSTYTSLSTHKVSVMKEKTVNSYTAFAIQDTER